MFNTTARKPGGYLIMTDANGETTERDTVQCCHCGGHWIVQPGSGTVRGWCTKCQARHCGSAGCMACVPTDLRLDMIEAQEKNILEVISRGK